MFRKTIILAALFCATILPANADLVSNVADVNEYISNTEESLERLRAKAIRDGDLVLEQRIDQISFSLRHLLRLASDDLDNKWDEIDHDINTYIQKLENQMESLATGVPRYIDQIELAGRVGVSDLCDGIPLCKSKPTISFIRGLTISDASIGDPLIVVGGTAITDSALVEVSIDGAKIDEERVRRGEGANTIEILVPKARLVFEDLKSGRAKMSIKVKKPASKPFFFWRKTPPPKTIYEANPNLYLLPRQPIAISGFVYSQDYEWTECENCQVSYEGRTQFERVSYHQFAIDPNYRLGGVVNWRDERSPDVAESDYYYYFCSKPREIEKADGSSAIFSKCFDAAINISCEGIARNFLASEDLETREQMIDYDYPCATVPATNREVRYAVKLEKRTPTLIKEVLKIRDPSLEQDNDQAADAQTNIGYGVYYSEPFESGDSTFAVIPNMRIGGPDLRLAEITEENSTIELGRLGTLNARLENVGTLKRVRLELRR